MWGNLSAKAFVKNNNERWLQNIMWILKQQEKKTHHGFCFRLHSGSHIFETGGAEKHRINENVPQLLGQELSHCICTI